MHVKEKRVRNRVDIWLVCVKFYRGAIKNAFKMNIFAIKIIIYHGKNIPIYNKIYNKIMVIYSIFLKFCPRGGVEKGPPGAPPTPGSQ